MTTQLVKWTAMHTTRRRFLARGLGGAFAAIAGATVGVPRAEAFPCTGPNGSGYCGDQYCTGHICHGSGGIQCGYVTGYCPTGTACWTWTSGKSCCDCACCITHCVYCFCYDK
jgi:hypothetical protein